MQKLYCYVDETGQDTGGKIFLVSIVIADETREEARKKLRRIEDVAGKKRKKWTRATRGQRKNYIQQVIDIKELAGCLYYSKYEATRAYVDLSILSVAKALYDKAKAPYEATIFVDGLKRAERPRFGAGLRKLKVRVRKVRGARDQSDEFIRLADAIAGFVRDSLEGDQVMKTLYEKIREKVMKEV